MTNPEPGWREEAEQLTRIALACLGAPPEQRPVLGSTLERSLERALTRAEQRGLERAAEDRRRLRELIADTLTGFEAHRFGPDWSWAPHAKGGRIALHELWDHYDELTRALIAEDRGEGVG